MSLREGAELGPYEILSPLGAGGMGEVYKARDRRLDRTVAIKVLPEHVAADTDLRLRFEREARVISSLSHPHICTLFDIGQQDDVDFLVMEYLEGETLAERLGKGPLPADQVLRYATEIAGALHKAHRQGLVHRDLKPGNVMLTQAGTKLLDFGLAKRQAPTGEPGGFSAQTTQSECLTAEGTILGTLQYMAPEQLEGREADQRTDIFAFGALVHEMATGERAFKGPSRATLIGAILKDDPPAISSLQPLTPPALDHVIATCLEKEPDDRWQSAADLGHELAWISESSRGQDGFSVPSSASTARSSHTRKVAMAAILAVAAALVSAVTVWNLKPRAPQPLARFAIPLPFAEPLQISGANPDVTFSPDGRHIVYMTGVLDREGQISVRAVDSLETRVLRSGHALYGPFVSADNAWVAFREDYDLRKISILGGPPVTICGLGGNLRGASWGADDTIIFATREAGTGLFRVSAGGGEPKPLTTPDLTKGEIGHHWPEILPGGKAVLFAVVKGSGSENHQIAVLSLETGEQRLLVSGGSNPHYASNGYLVYGVQGTLRAVPFDLHELEVTGDPVPVLDSVGTKASGAANFGLSSSGSLVFVPGTAKASPRESTVVWVNRNGEELAPVVGHMLDDPRHPRLSPDARRLALAAGPYGARRIWVYDLEGHPGKTLTLEGSSLHPIWNPDGTHIAFASTKNGASSLFSIRADGSQIDPAPLLTSPTARVAGGISARVPADWSPDGGELIFSEQRPETGGDVFALPIDGDREPRVLLGSSSWERGARLSPDGRWLAFESNVTDRAEIWVMPYPGPGAPTRISARGGTEPVWSRDGRELFYLDGDTMMAVTVQREPELRFEEPEELFDKPYFHNPRPSYDVSPDGRFIMFKREPAGEHPETAGSMVVILNWFNELEKRGL